MSLEALKLEIEELTDELNHVERHNTWQRRIFRKRRARLRKQLNKKIEQLKEKKQSDPLLGLQLTLI